MKISDKKIQKIFEQILYYLYSINPKATYTSYIAEEIARDEEFVKKLLFELKSKNLIIDNFDQLNRRYADHGLVWHNRKFIYDPIYNNYLPIYFDGIRHMPSRMQQKVDAALQPYFYILGGIAHQQRRGDFLPQRFQLSHFLD